MRITKLFPIFVSMVIFVVFFLLLSVSQIYAAPQPISNDPATLEDLEKLFVNFLSVASAIGGFIAFTVILAGGFRYITAQGDPKAIAAARSTLTWAIVGLALMIVAWLLINFLAAFTGLPLTVFRITSPFPF